MKRWEGARLKTLYLYELKKIVCRKSVWITGCVMLFLFVWLSFADLFNTSVTYSEGGEEIHISGYELMKIRRECARKLSGREIDDALLREMRDFYQGEEREEAAGTIDPATGAIVTVTEGDPADREETARGGSDGMDVAGDGADPGETVGDGADPREDTGDGADPMETDRDKLLERFAEQRKYLPVYIWVLGMMGNDESIYAADADGLYSEREHLIDQNRRDQMLTQNERTYWEENDAGLKVPFTYEYMEGWGNLWSQANIINCMLLLLLTVSLSHVFSEEHLRKTDAMILCSRHGKRELYTAKILAGMTFGAAAALLLSGTALLSNLAVYGADGFGGALQIEFPLSSWRISMGGAILFLMLLLLLISAMYSMTVMFLSEWLKKSAGVMAVPFGIMIFTLFIDIPYSYGTVSKVYELLPTNLLMTWELWDDRLLSVLGNYMTLFQAAPMVYILISALLLLMGKRIWKRCQVGE